MRHQYFLLVFVFLLIHFEAVHAQPLFDGKIVNTKDGKPVASATISLNNTGRKALSDAYGRFMILLNSTANNDSILISSIGYKSLKLAVHDAVQQNEFSLAEEAKELQPVVLFAKEKEQGSASLITCYYRAWKTNHTGGEIGKVFETGQKKFKLGKVRFKVDTGCDTCQVRLHVRDVVNGEPGQELLTDSISTMLHHLMFDDKLPEFNLEPYNIILEKSTIFISLEVLHCSRNAGENCSLCFIGTEQGGYMYKPALNSNWEQNRDYSIYLRIFYKY